jgi:hypothetical protein
MLYYLRGLLLNSKLVFHKAKALLLTRRIAVTYK